VEEYFALVQNGGQFKRGGQPPGRASVQAAQAAFEGTGGSPKDYSGPFETITPEYTPGEIVKAVDFMDTILYG
jgi:hypothetical protein